MATIKTSFARTRQRLMTKTGQSEETVDVEYHYEKEKVFSSEERMVRLQKNAKKMIDLYKDLSKAMSELSSDACDLYEESDPLYRPASRIKEMSSDMEKNRQVYEENMTTSFQQPILAYISQYKEIRKRTEECTTRRIDMDRYKNDIGKLREKSSSHVLKQKLAPTEEKYQFCKEGYESLHMELLEDLPRLYEDRNAYFTYLLAALVKGQNQFYESMANEWHNMPQMVAGINDQAGKDHPQVITSVGTSSASINIRNDPAFKANASIKTKQTSEFQTTAGPLAKDLKSNTPNDTSNLGTVVQPNPAFQHTGKQGSGAQLATALYDFAGMDSTELSFKAGDRIIIHKKDGEWMEGELHGMRGLVPANYVQL
ncbi:SH3 domain-containing protein [Cavenderia fasciculata]|uniref:SH3 domain-containing protein n=1 Tax=Cavenderia fasciculata TaxID=261658 RepID=F4PL20_CACFS|nr:SH3 domain-containing protein [Cavenderia fasciculata]EGG23242.1 SH3 domain-containing protein [Cavenderia fasciculata]|eukprot:XP_004361093.1 SH3 domain-containing protein [Cavenderia fasciculata]